MKTLVVVSYFDARPVDDLQRLLAQLAADPRRGSFDLLVAINSVAESPHDWRAAIGPVDVLVRENHGFNIAAWQAAWLSRPHYDAYVFLQDDCVIADPGWLGAFRRALRSPRTGWVGEAYIRHRDWSMVDAQWHQVHAEFDRKATELAIPCRYPPAHLQTVALAASRLTLERTGGFVIGTSKAEAVAGEILTSVRARHLGLRNRQLAVLPYQYIRHPQWNDLRAASLQPVQAVRHAVRHYLSVTGIIS